MSKRAERQQRLLERNQDRADRRSDPSYRASFGEVNPVGAAYAAMAIVPFADRIALEMQREAEQQANVSLPESQTIVAEQNTQLSPELAIAVVGIAALQTKKLSRVQRTKLLIMTTLMLATGCRPDATIAPTMPPQPSGEGSAAVVEESSSGSNVGLGVEGNSGTSSDSSSNSIEAAGEQNAGSQESESVGEDVLAVATVTPNRSDVAPGIGGQTVPEIMYSQVEAQRQFLVDAGVFSNDAQVTVLLGGDGETLYFTDLNNLTDIDEVYGTSALIQVDPSLERGFFTIGNETWPTELGVVMQVVGDDGRVWGLNAAGEHVGTRITMTTPEGTQRAELLSVAEAENAMYFAVGEDGGFELDPVKLGLSEEQAEGVDLSEVSNLVHVGEAEYLPQSSGRGVLFRESNSGEWREVSYGHVVSVDGVVYRAEDKRLVPLEMPEDVVGVLDGVAWTLQASDGAGGVIVGEDGTRLALVDGNGEVSRIRSLVERAPQMEGYTMELVSYVNLNGEEAERVNYYNEQGVREMSFYAWGELETQQAIGWTPEYYVSHYPDNKDPVTGERVLPMPVDPRSLSGEDYELEYEMTYQDYILNVVLPEGGVITNIIGGVKNALLAKASNGGFLFAMKNYEGDFIYQIGLEKPREQNSIFANYTDTSFDSQVVDNSISVGDPLFRNPTPSGLATPRDAIYIGFDGYVISASHVPHAYEGIPVLLESTLP